MAWPKVDRHLAARSDRHRTIAAGAEHEGERGDFVQELHFIGETSFFALASISSAGVPGS
jgi:hypothetical protein